MLFGKRDDLAQTMKDLQQAKQDMYLQIQSAFGGMGMGLMGQASLMERPKPKDIPEEELICATGGLVAWRGWNIETFGDRIRSFNGTEWEPKKKLVAVAIGSESGIYAWKKRDAVAKDTNISRIWGEVWLWGRVLECELGYRAEFAYPKSFVNTGIQAKKMAKMYKVELLGCESGSR